ncbi:GNAT family N-acetyltransferase [Nonomuraea sp. bgisy101]|uniref:GNAT family N-acetyltransferase n=1 Tax=Nonomuraea sp. bgisy101 TaxID=3413784 RepID=UPI003D740F0C
MDFDRLVDEAWPALERVELDGWTLRHAEGVTKRANSVLVTGTPADLGGAIESAEAFYADRGLPAVFSLGSRAAALDPVLEERGYRLVDPVLVMVASSSPGPAAHEVRIEDAPWQGWLESWWAVDGRYGEGMEAAEKICTGVPAWYAAVEEDGVALAVGRGVPQGDTLGVYCMATLPQARRRGLARSVLRALVRHAGLASSYLVTKADNAAGVEFYRGEGFADAGGYHYRVA